MQGTNPQQPLETKQPRTQWLTFQCPVCDRRMYTHAFESASNERTGQQYIKTKCTCVTCDIKLTTLVPRKVAATIVDEDYLPPPAA